MSEIPIGCTCGHCDDLVTEIRTRCAECGQPNGHHMSTCPFRPGARPGEWCPCGLKQRPGSCGWCEE